MRGLWLKQPPLFFFRFSFWSFATAVGVWLRHLLPVSCLWFGGCQASWDQFNNCFCMFLFFCGFAVIIFAYRLTWFLLEFHYFSRWPYFLEYQFYSLCPMKCSIVNLRRDLAVYHLEQSTQTQILDFLGFLGTQKHWPWSHQPKSVGVYRAPL